LLGLLRTPVSACSYRASAFLLDWLYFFVKQIFYYYYYYY